MYNENRHYWKCTLIGEFINKVFTEHVAIPITGLRLESMVMNACMQATYLHADRANSIYIEDVQCVCAACQGTGRTTKPVKGYDTPVKCPRCKGTGTFETRESLSILFPTTDLKISRKTTKIKANRPAKKV